jgi:hypothetical protein
MPVLTNLSSLNLSGAQILIIMVDLF